MINCGQALQEYHWKVSEGVLQQEEEVLVQYLQKNLRLRILKIIILIWLLSVKIQSLLSKYQSLVFVVYRVYLPDCQTDVTSLYWIPPHRYQELQELSFVIYESLNHCREISIHLIKTSVYLALNRLLTVNIIIVLIETLEYNLVDTDSGDFLSVFHS